MKKFLQLALFLPLASALLESNDLLANERCVFPQDPSVLDVKRDFGAKDDGMADDTAALQAGIAASSNWGKDSGTKILYLPNGTYRVTSNLVVNARVGPWVYGESRDGVVIRLSDGVPTHVTAVLRRHPSDTQASSADFFMRNFRNLTIDAGRNPHVDGVRWYGWPDFKNHTIADSGWSTVSGAVGDVDGDGDLDVLLGGSVWFENPGNLRAAPGQPWKLHRIAEDPTHDIAVGDFNGDGRLDAVTRNQSEFGAKSGNRIRIWLQQTDAPWQGTELECPHGEGLAVPDLDRDGDPDIAIGGTWFETIREGVQVRWPAQRFAEFHRNATVAVADFTGDGRPDVAPTDAPRRQNPP